MQCLLCGDWLEGSTAEGPLPSCQKCTEEANTLSPEEARWFCGFWDVETTWESTKFGIIQPLLLCKLFYTNVNVFITSIIYDRIL